MVEAGHGVVRSWWVKVAGGMGPSAVVVVNVLGEHHTQVPLVEDQYAVGEFGSESAPVIMRDRHRPVMPQVTAV